MTIVLVFYLGAKPAGAAKLHAATCKQVTRARGRRAAVVVAHDVQGTIDDLTERGYGVKACPCVRK